ncbi:early nodulin-93-like [Nymphaea colorata]|nr:early nodulin-93-like [Nymphaea colorata]
MGVDQSAAKPGNSSTCTISCPLEMNTGLGYYMDQRVARARRYAHEGVVAGAKAAIMATAASAIPTLASVRMFPWARRNLNPTAQALIISTVAGAAYFVVADKKVLASARKNSFRNAQE